MDWVHCNVCYFQPGQLPKRNFILTNCGHIFCQYCEHAGIIEKCKMCGVKCSTTHLSSQMNRKLEVYFEDPEETLENLQKALLFQRSHRLRINENYRKLVGKYERLKLDYQRLEDRVRQQQEELDNLKENRSPRRIFTPPFPHQLGVPLFCKNSSISRAILNNNSQQRTPNSTSQSPLGFMTSQEYRTPITPPSVSSISPVSVASSNRCGQTAGGRGRRSPYGPEITPPFSRLRTLSVNPLMSRNPASRHEFTHK